MHAAKTMKMTQKDITLLLILERKAVRTILGTIRMSENDSRNRAKHETEKKS